MWQRFTERARKVVFYAQEEAQNYGEGYVSTEHLLLGLVRESDSVAVKVIEGMGVSRDIVRAEVERQLPAGESRSPQDMTLTPRAKRVIDLSYDEARNLNNNYIGTEHLLLGLVREGDGLAGRVLHKLGIDLELTRRHVIALQQTVHAGQGSIPEPARPPKTYGWDQYEGDARRVILLADEMAKAHGSPQVTPYYLLKALLSIEESAAMKALRKVQVDPAQLDQALENHNTWAAGAPPIALSPYARQIIERSALEADSLNREVVGSEALLLGLIFGNRQGIGSIFSECGIAPTRLRDAVVQVLEEGGSSD